MPWLIGDLVAPNRAKKKLLGATKFRSIEIGRATDRAIWRPLWFYQILNVFAVHFTQCSYFDATY